MLQVSGNYEIQNLSPSELRERIEQRPNLFLPPSIDKYSFGHYQEITGKRHGFQINPRWQAMPNGPWSVLLEATEKPENPEKLEERQVTYKLTVDRERGLLFTGFIIFTLTSISADNENGANLHIQVEGSREAELAEYTDEIVITVLRSLMREGAETLNLQLNGNEKAEMLVPVAETDEDHMAPLAVAAGVFSAGMALSLWLWRRKKRKQSA